MQNSLKLDGTKDNSLTDFHEFSRRLLVNIKRTDVLDKMISLLTQIASEVFEFYKDSKATRFNFKRPDTVNSDNVLEIDFNGFPIVFTWKKG